MEQFWNGTYLTFPDYSSACIFCFSYPKWRPSSNFEFFLYVSHRPAHLIPVPPFCQQVPRPINSASVISFVYVSSSVFSWGRHFSLLWSIAKFLQLLPLPPVSFPTNLLYTPPLKFFPKYSLIKKKKSVQEYLLFHHWQLGPTLKSINLPLSFSYTFSQTGLPLHRNLQLVVLSPDVPAGVFCFVGN